MPPPPEGPPDRTTLARWLTARDNPLTARVFVNRWWAELFGRGIVRSGIDMFVVGLGVALVGYVMGDLVARLL